MKIIVYSTITKTKIMNNIDAVWFCTHLNIPIKWSFNSPFPLSISLITLFFGNFWFNYRLTNRYMLSLIPFTNSSTGCYCCTLFKWKRNKSMDTFCSFFSSAYCVNQLPMHSIRPLSVELHPNQPNPIVIVALVYLTSYHRPLSIPTNQNYNLLSSHQECHALESKPLQLLHALYDLFVYLPSNHK